MKLDSVMILAIVIAISVLVMVVMFRFETLSAPGLHKNRFTNAVCHVSQECW